jgi:hypothetical protein
LYEYFCGVMSCLLKHMLIYMLHRKFEPCEGIEDLSLTGQKVVVDSVASSSRSVSTSVVWKLHQ